MGIKQLADDNGRGIEGVYFLEETSEGETSLYTQNLVAGQRFSANEITFDLVGGQLRVMSPVTSNLSLSIACGLRTLFVKRGSMVLYLAHDDFSAVTVSHLSDIVGNNGAVFVAINHKITGNAFDHLFALRPNVHHLVNADTTNPNQCMESLQAAFNGPVRIDTLYCELGRADQVDCLSAHASLILKSGAHFVAFFKVPKTVLRTNPAVVVPPSEALFSEMDKLKEHGFQVSKGSDFGEFKRGWGYVVGSYKGVTGEE